MTRPLGVLVLAVLLSGCVGATSDDGSASSAGNGPDVTTAPPGYEEVPPGYDESPDGPAPTPDARLDATALSDLLRTRASATADRSHCRPGEVSLGLEGYDAAAGSRYTRIVARNTSERTCVIEGVPGIGARGQWGTAFVPEVVGYRAPDQGAVPVRSVELVPGASAASDLQWGGELTGAESERASLLVVQLAVGQVPAPVPAVIAGEPGLLDIGIFTTLHVAPFVLR